MNINFKKRMAIISIFYKGVTIDTIQAATGIDKSTIAHIIQNAESTKGKKAILQEIQELNNKILNRQVAQ